MLSKNIILEITKVLFIILGLQTISVNGDGTLCNQVFNFDAYFSVALLKKDTYYKYKMLKTVESQGEFTYPVDGVFTKVLDDAKFLPNGYDYLFNFCSPVRFFTNSSEPCGAQLNAKPSTYGMLAYLKGDATQIKDQKYYGECDQIETTQLTTDSKFENYEFQLIDEDKPQDGFVYHLWQPLTLENTVDPTKPIHYNMSMTYIFRCDSTANEFTNMGWRYIRNDTLTGFYLELHSKYGCPTLQLSKLWQILSDNDLIFTILMILIGTALCFFGLKIYKPTLFIIGYITGFAGIIAIMGEFVIRYDSESIMAYACLIIAVFFGVLTGYVTVSMPKLGFFALGMWLGVVLALLCNNAFLYKIQIGNQFVVLWLTIAILSSTMCLLSCFFYKHCVMVCTGFIGSYCLIRPFGWILGDFPNELQIAKELKYGTITKVPNLFYLYFALIILIGIIGIKFQYSMYYSRRLDEEQNDLQLYLADPDFVDMNKSLLDKDDEDLTTKEKEIKRKLIRMQKNVEKEKQRQEKFLKQAEKIKRRERGEDVSSDSEEDSDNNNSDEDNEEGNRTQKSNRSRNKSKDLGLFNAMQRTESRRKSKIKKQASDSNSDEDIEKSSKIKSKKNGKSKYDDTPDHVVEKADKKFSNMFAGIKKNNKQAAADHEDDPDIEMDDLSETNYANYAYGNENDTKKKSIKEDQHHSDESNSDNEDQAKDKKKNAKNAAKLAKSQKKNKK